MHDKHTFTVAPAVWRDAIIPLQALHGSYLVGLFIVRVSASVGAIMEWVHVCVPMSTFVTFWVDSDLVVPLYRV